MKRWILPLLVGWGLALLFSPRDAVQLVRGRK